MLEIVSEDNSSLRKHTIAYGKMLTTYGQSHMCIIVFFVHVVLAFAVSGMGFGVIAAVVNFANTLNLSGGPAIVGINYGGSPFFVLCSGELKEVLLLLQSTC